MHSVPTPPRSMNGAIAGGKQKQGHWRLKWFSVFTGMVALVWFLVRVLPKPSRALYPCQRTAFPLASGFVIWMMGLIGAKAMHRKAMRLVSRKRYILGAAVLIIAVLTALVPLGIRNFVAAQNPTPLNSRDASLPFVPSEGPNRPMGVGKGIHPGRVVWTHNPNATAWDGKTGNWWDDANTNAKIVDDMVSKTLLALAGAKTDKQSWNALFKYFNRTHQRGNAGYKAGERIAIKINANQDRTADWGAEGKNGLTSPHVIYSVIKQLVNNAGVRGQDIAIYDASDGRGIGTPIYDKIRKDPDPNLQSVQFLAGKKLLRPGQIEAEPDLDAPVTFGDKTIPIAYVPKVASGATYAINLAVFRQHFMFGQTLTGKNHFGSVFFPNDGGWSPRPLHNSGARTNLMGTYNCLVDLIAHKDLGGKTFLFIIDGLYPGEHNEAGVIKYRSMNDDWLSSIFMSEDPVAIDSVGLDILRNEPKAPEVRGSVDNYLHEAALIADPPSKTVYDPNKTGKRLASLGVHEHWNNSTDKKYSRNMEKSEGIELIFLDQAPVKD
jgi:hypothetical protein